MHNPTTPNQQGHDVGSQYRSAIFFHDNVQKETAQSVIRRLDNEKIWESPIVTEVKPFESFYKAEDYHQKYYKRHDQGTYCNLVINPKLAKIRREYRYKLKKSASWHGNDA